MSDNATKTKGGAVKSIKVDRLSVPQLVDRYVEIGEAQYQARRRDDIGGFNRLVDDLIAVEAELKAREGDQRRVLAALYGHQNMQVRLNAAHATLAVAPLSARAMLEAMRDSRWMPQAMDAGMSLRNLDSGVYKPK